MLTLAPLGCAPRPAGHVAADATPGRPAAGVATERRFAAPFDRLAPDIRRAIKRCGWGMVWLDERPPAPGAGPAEKAAATEPPRVDAEALVPDGRSARITATAVDDGDVLVTIRVGHFGDPRLEARFLKRLGTTLAGKTKRRRGGTFTLPDPVTPPAN